MAEKTSPRWLDWAREIQAITQNGLHYTENEYDRQRYQRLEEIASEIINQQTGVSENEMLAAFHMQQGYATPKVDVRGAVFREGKILLVRERRDGGWTMPGGWADVGNVPSEAAEREVWEEAGFKVKTRKLVGVYDANRLRPLELFHAYKLVFLCDLLSGEARTSFETSEVDFFSLQEIPASLSGERTQMRHIVDAFTAWINPDLPTYFD